MSRILDVLPEHMTPDMKETLAAQKTQFMSLTWQLVMAHLPAQLKAMGTLMGTFATDSIVPKRLIEIAVVAVSHLNDCRHCSGRHSVRLVQLGLSPDTVSCLLDVDVPDLSDQERLVRDYAVAVSEYSANIDDAMIDRLRVHFSEAQIVELTLRIALAGFFNRFNNALGISLDDDHIVAGKKLGLTL
ncbi:carboxymuconolactone decarboxylase family protein [Pigmentiphaga aceris]|uniref:Carboxymuconolactone decarboxylase family protein n=1 Tax=Pigmentiphaga aceris TaxID=1940612 RepID=A0A5C0B5M9_9BURK|nr:carboxymuconolactone decarboxylase family protein [Pigmentiphaga aceris]QEI08630.1 carboxymuconolactone decarboxylase family protein [Pigmentiphaga aceris]